MTPGTPYSMFGSNQPRRVTMNKDSNGFWGFTLRGSYPPFVLDLDELGLASRNVGVYANHPCLFSSSPHVVAPCLARSLALNPSIHPSINRPSIQGILVGDHVMEINGVDTREKPHRDCVQLVKQAGNSLTLVVLSKRSVTA